LNKPPGAFAIRPALAEDAPGVAACVDRAYAHYVARIGKKPGPMLEDYAEVIARQRVFVAESEGAIAGMLALAATEEGFLLETIAVDPMQQGAGAGRALLERAEAEAVAAGHASIYLYTHEKMTENLALYARIGYVEYDRRIEHGYSRVYMRKKLGP
jgi:N-acetylglutamate synthase-like GNAT family acetyltransferase